MLFIVCLLQFVPAVSLAGNDSCRTIDKITYTVCIPGQWGINDTTVNNVNTLTVAPLPEAHTSYTANLDISYILRHKKEITGYPEQYRDDWTKNQRQYAYAITDSGKMELGRLKGYWIRAGKSVG